MDTTPRTLQKKDFWQKWVPLDIKHLLFVSGSKFWHFIVGSFCPELQLWEALIFFYAAFCLVLIKTGLLTGGEVIMTDKFQRRSVRHVRGVQSTHKQNVLLFETGNDLCNDDATFLTHTETSHFITQFSVSVSWLGIVRNGGCLGHNGGRGHECHHSSASLLHLFKSRVFKTVRNKKKNQINKDNCVTVQFNYLKMTSIPLRNSVAKIS